MARLVRVRVDGVEFNVGAAYATAKGLEVIDSPTHGPDSRTRGATRLNGRPRKPKRSISALVAEKAAPTVSGASDASAEAASSADDINNDPSPEEI